MKEATGELNMTVVVVVAVGVLAAFFYTIIWPMIKTTFVSSSKCSDAVCTKNADDKTATCIYYNKNGEQEGESFQCVWKG